MLKHGNQITQHHKIHMSSHPFIVNAIKSFVFNLLRELNTNSFIAGRTEPKIIKCFLDINS